jgi:hypothetical protein
VCESRRNVSSWHWAAEQECPYSRRVLEGKRPCAGLPSTAALDPNDTLGARSMTPAEVNSQPLPESLSSLLQCRPFA